MAKIRNPMCEKKPLGNGYYYQSIRLPNNASFVKIWYKGKVIDRALNVTSARAMAKRYAERNMFDGI